MSTTSTSSSEVSPVKRALIALEDMKARLQASELRMSQPLAIVGMGCRFPGGADSPEECWKLLREGRDAVTEVPRDRWDIDAYYDPDPDAPGKMSTRWGGFLQGVDRFDPELFGISPREAVTMDPQQRILLEVVWEALERAGISPERLMGSRTGVFLGIATNDYAEILAQNTAPDRIDAYFASGVAHSIASGRISYCLGLQGPSVSIDTACSSSLVAVAQACQSLRVGDSDMAIAAGVNVVLRPDHGITFSKSRMMAPDGRCKTFDARADGFVRAEGCGVLILKRLSDAQAAGDDVLAVIRGVALNQDGASSGLTAPNGASQEALLRAALANAQLNPDDVAYIEAHGTGTSLGDPIEVRALGKVFGRDRDPDAPLLIGSAKTNFGHLEAAAGITGLIKAVLTLMHRELPPSLHFKTPNPHIAWDELPIRVVTATQPFPQRNGRRVAGVSSFGFSGTNAHVLIEEAPQAAVPAPQSDRPLHVLALSAKSESALRQLAGSFAQHIERHPTHSLADVCHTAAAGRGHFTHRLALKGADRVAVARDLRNWVAGENSAVWSEVSSAGVRPKIAFLFTGQGSQYVGMGRELYEREPVFRDVLDRCASVLASRLPRPLLQVMFEDTTGLLDQTQYTQPALFVLEVALAELWRSWGVQPSMVLGHSVGEYAAACTAGVLSIEDGARLVAARGRLMQALPSGGVMMTVQGDHSGATERVVAEFSDRVSIAAFNAPGSRVISGESAAVAAVTKRLEQAGLLVQPLTVSHAFHSPLMEPMLAEFGALAQSMEHRTPQVGWVSNVTGGVLPFSDWSTRMGEYWRRHVREPVRFEDGVRSAVAQGVEYFIEVGPQPVLSGLGRATLGEDTVSWLASMKRNRDVWSQLLESLARLYVRGVRIAWPAVDAPYVRRRLTLPTYPFQRERHWVQMLPQRVVHANAASHGLLGRRIDTPALSGALFASSMSAQSPAAFALDHRVFGAPILPGTAYIAMAAAAGTQLLHQDGIELRDITFNEVLGIPESQSREVQLVAHNTEGGALRIEIFSREDATAGWTLHSAARALKSKVSLSRADSFEDARRRCTETISHDAFYADLQHRGLDFGPLFRGVASVRRGDRIAVSEVVLPEALHGEAANYLIHPVLLDACVQLLAAAAAGTTSAEAIFLPVQIDVCRIAASSSPLTQCRAEAIVRDFHEAAQALTADVHVSDASGRCLASLEGIQLKRVGRSALERVGGDIAKWLIDLTWQPEPAADILRAEAIASAVQAGVRARVDASGWGVWAQVQSKLDAACRGYIARALQTLGCSLIPGQVLHADTLAQQLRVKPVFRRLLGRFLQILADDGVLEATRDGWRVLRQPLQRDPDESLRVLAQQYPQFAAELTFARRCGPEIAAALTGKCDPLQLLFPGGDASTAEHLYRDSPSAKLYNGLVSDAVAQVVAGLPAKGRIRVLEIGGGTGSTTAHVLPTLPADRTDYLFTDISPLFVARAQERYADAGFVRAAPLDIEREPSLQGITGEFDIVIASNVLHATRNLADVFARVRKLLAPNGVLIALEITRPQDWIDISFGFTEGWWRFDDFDWRPDYPLLTSAQWKPFLQAQGFHDVALLPSDADDADPLSLNVVVIARPGVAAQRVSRRRLVLADRGGVGRQLVEILERSGEQIATAYVGREYAQLGNRSYAVDPTDRSGFERLIAEASASLGGPLDGIIHLWSLDPQLHRTDAVQKLRSATAQVQGGVLHLGQALLKSNMSSAPFFIVTRGGVQLGDQPVVPLAATLWGWARALRLETRELRCVSVDLDPGDEPASAQLLAATLARTDGESQIAWRNKVSHVARLAVSQAEQRAEVSSSETQPQRLTARSRGVLDNLALEPLQRTPPGPGQAEIRVRATGLNFRDVLSVLGMYPGDQGPLGSECAGQVVAVGPGVESLRVGDEVVAIAPGAFASHVLADARLVVQRPRGLSCVEAASLPNVFLTAQWALERLGGMKAGDRVLIHAAAGGVGLAAIQLAQRAGAEIYATAGSEEKHAYLRSIGVRHIFSSRSLEFAAEVRSATRGHGVDLVLNSLAGEFIEASLGVVADGGAFLEIGRNDVWSIERVREVRPDVRYHTIDLGKDYAATPDVIRPMLTTLLDDVANGRLQRPPLRTFPLAEGAAAFRFMAQARHIGKLVLTQPWQLAGESTAVRTDASYLVTGGLTGLGLAVAEWLAERGARNLILMGRRAPAEQARTTLANLSKRGVKVVVVQGDVADEHDVARLFATIREAGVPRLAGLIHAAGSLDDGALNSQTMERYARVFAAKIDGAWLMDQATRTEPLDFEVFFSSAAALLGSAGQTNHAAANAYLDALAASLRAEGRPAISIQWGAWSEIGAAAGQGVAARLAERGLEPIPPAQGLKAFAHVLRRAPAAIGVVAADWNRLTEQWPAPLRTYAELLVESRRASTPSPAESPSRASSADHTGLIARLNAAPVNKRRALLQAEIRGLAMKVLSLAPTHPIDLKAPLNGLGLDSLMAVELRNFLARATGRTLPATLLFDYPSIDALTGHLSLLLDLEPATATAPATQVSGVATRDLLDQVEQMSEEELDRLLAARMKVN
jgi:acyl transferase domain-containing protein/NADPH:quinone reductase-like Zn-dependent oxidoreductase/NAD(P)-dependent dehydrogenase (short-subunit alcohol dehydrogenase family)/SAM-dependent methyltransferase/acyl carrier protein